MILEQFCRYVVYIAFDCPGLSREENLGSMKFLVGLSQGHPAIPDAASDIAAQIKGLKRLTSNPLGAVRKFYALFVYRLFLPPIVIQQEPSMMLDSSAGLLTTFTNKVAHEYTKNVLRTTEIHEARRC